MALRSLSILAVGLILGLSGLAYSPVANAVSSVVVGGSTFYCQNTCVVTNYGGQLLVGDSLGGWVIKKVNSGHISVPNSAKTSQDSSGK